MSFQHSFKSKIGNRVEINHKNEEIIEDYFNLKNSPHFAKVDENDPVRPTPLTDLILARRQLSETKARLDKHVVNAAGNSKTKEKRSHEQKERYIQLHQNFLRFDEFVKENEAKRKRAEARIEKKNAIQKQYIDEIADLEVKIKDLQTVEEQLQQQVNDYHLYRDFLKKASEESSEFAEIKDILSRYEALAGTRSLLGEQQANALSDVQTAQENLTSAAASHAYSTMELQTQLAKLRVRREDAHASATKWEDTLTRVRTLAAEKAINVTQVKEACWHLYKAMCRSAKQLVTAQESDTESQIVYIARRIRQLEVVVKNVQSKWNNTQPKSFPQTATSTISKGNLH